MGFGGGNSGSSSSSGSKSSKSSGGYTSIKDMFDGGGPGQSGDTFGGALGGVSNAVGATPYKSGKKATGLARAAMGGYDSPRDMVDGGGAGKSGKTFGGLLGGVSNAVGATPLGSGREPTGIAGMLSNKGGGTSTAKPVTFSSSNRSSASPTAAPTPFSNKGGARTNNRSVTPTYNASNYNYSYDAPLTYNPGQYQVTSNVSRYNNMLGGGYGGYQPQPMPRYNTSYNFGGYQPQPQPQPMPMPMPQPQPSNPYSGFNQNLYGGIAALQPERNAFGIYSQPQQVQQPQPQPQPGFGGKGGMQPPQPPQIQFGKGGQPPSQGGFSSKGGSAGPRFGSFI